MQSKFKSALIKVGNVKQQIKCKFNRKVSKCAVCGSSYHWARECPDATYYLEELFKNFRSKGDVDGEYEVTLI